MSDLAIKVDGLSKRYLIGSKEKVHDTLGGALAEFIGKPIANFRRLRRLANFTSDPMGTSGPSPAAEGQNGDIISALDDVSFEVRQGEVVGIIGYNGAGKTTLLKVLSRITEPTSGRALVRGRVSSLLEVGTGFHPELTGRENVYLNGAILGMSKAEIDRKFDEIVAFSGVEKFLDTPVKRYSSGMGLRLAFAVAAHLEPEILLVDEVLAVGDPLFQQKCLDRMKDITNRGRTILLVSHNMAAVRGLCERVLFLSSGKIILDGHPEEVISRFMGDAVQGRAVINGQALSKLVYGTIRHDDPTIRLREVALLDANGTTRNRFRSDEEINIVVTYDCLQPVRDVRVSIHIVDEFNSRILSSQDVDSTPHASFGYREPGRYRAICALPANLFGEKRFYVSAHVIHRKIETLHADRVVDMEVEFAGYNNIFHSGTYKDAYIRPLLQWQTEVLGSGVLSKEEMSGLQGK